LALEFPELTLAEGYWMLVVGRSHKPTGFEWCLSYQQEYNWWSDSSML